MGHKSICSSCYRISTFGRSMKPWTRYLQRVHRERIYVLKTKKIVSGWRCRWYSKVPLKSKAELLERTAYNKASTGSRFQAHTHTFGLICTPLVLPVVFIVGNLGLLGSPYYAQDLEPVTIACIIFQGTRSWRKPCCCRTGMVQVWPALQQTLDWGVFRKKPRYLHPMA
jgi:hypothetical protein